MGFLILGAFAVSTSSAAAQSRAWVAAPHEFSQMSAWAFGDGADGSLWQAEVLCAAGEAFLIVGPVGMLIDDQGGAIQLNVDGAQLQRQARFISDALVGWRVVADQQILDALRSGNRFTVTTPFFGSAQFGLRGSSNAISRTLNNCGPGRGPNPMLTGFFEFSGMAGGHTLNMPLMMPGPYIKLAARSHIEETCGGPADFDSSAAFQLAFVDGDDVEDVIVDWSHITCRGRPFPRGGGNCGVQACAAMIFATRAFRPGSRPQSIFHIGLFLEDTGPVRIISARTDGGMTAWIWRGGRLVAEGT